jgi:heme/copper-type cytochrome/quinol oxidase subunit 3
MMREHRFTHDLAQLPTHAFGPRSLTWWGTIGYMVIEATSFVLTFGAYFFLMSHEYDWPPEPWFPPDMVAGTIFTVVLLLSEIPNTMTKHAAEAHDTVKVRKLLPLMAAIGAVLLVIRIFEFPSLNISWHDNAYGSILWALLVLHTALFATDWVDTLVLAALVQTPLGFEGRRMVDTSENALYWRFVWIMWLPIYVMIYWLPRWFE